MAGAWALWNGGDKIAAKRAAEQVLQGSPSPEAAAEARDLLSRLHAPLRAYGYALIAAAVICTMILIALFRSGNPAS